MFGGYYCNYHNFEFVLLKEKKGNNDCNYESNYDKINDDEEEGTNGSSRMIIAVIKDHHNSQSDR